MTSRLLTLLTPLALLAATPAAAQSTEARLVAEPTAIAPGEPFTVALELDHPDEWHSYYKNSGGPELPLRIEWSLPEGFSAGPIQWPVPEVKDGFFGNSYIYTGAPVFLFELSPPASLEPGSSVTLSARPRWQICKQLCKDEPQPPRDFTLELAVADEAEPNPEHAALFERARAALPASAGDTEFRVESAPEAYLLRFSPPAGVASDPAGLEFVPDQPFVDALGAGGEVVTEDGEWVVRLPRRTTDAFDEPIEQGDAIGGILVFPDGSEPTAIRVPETPIASPPPPPLPFTAFLPVLGGMLIGGLILNLMPCVFPVIGLKIMGFVQQAGEDRRKIILHGVSFAVGVLLSFWILSGVLFFIRETSDTELGWGFQLQNKWFVYGLVMLFWVFGLSMFGLFEIGSSATSVGGSLQSKQGLGGSFFSGVLATIAATPCSAPILGPAIGAAIVLPAAQFFTAFTAMALGLALPYLILSIFPKLVDMLPRPGPWMESFKQGMAFLLIGAAAFFFWFYMDHVKEEILYLVMIGFVLIAMAAWIYGRWSVPSRPTRARWGGRVVALLLAALGAWLATGPYRGLSWEEWSPSRVEQALEEGRPVYVDFTAKWCATCQVNKQTAYTDEVIRLFKERDVLTLKADKTLPDPRIDAAIAELGRAAIPVNVLHVPGEEVVVTPEVLTPGYLTELLQEHLPPDS